MSPYKLLSCIGFLTFCISPIPSLFAEIRVFEKEVEEIVGRYQSQEQVEAFALQKAKRLAVEEAGTYISSLTVVQNFRLLKDEITALASGIVQAKIVGVPSIEVKNGVIHVRVKARIDVDCSVLDRQIEAIMKEKGTLKTLEEERQKVRDLENKLTSLKSSEVKRLEELNAQAIALERERERQRLILEEQSLKAKGELKKAEVERLQKQREMHARMNKTIAEQEKARREEAEALEKEHDRIRRAQLENEQRWNELIRKSQLRQTEWAPIDDSLSLMQAIEETKQLKIEIVNLNRRMDVQFEENKRNLQEAFKQQIALMVPQLPANPGPKDPFERTDEYNKRLADHAKNVKNAKKQHEAKVQKLKVEEEFRIVEAQSSYIGQKITILEPFIKRLQALQEKRFLLPDGNVHVSLGDPDADRSRFPLELRYKGQKWNTFWEYTDRDKAKDFWKTKTYLKGQGLFQLFEAKNGIVFALTGARVTHPGVEESRDFSFEKPISFSEISNLSKFKKELSVLKGKEEMIAIINSGKYKDPVTGMEFAFIKGGCFEMGDTFGDGAEDEKPVHEVCVDDFFLGIYEVTQEQWEKVMGNNPSKFREGGKYPVEMVSWDDAQQFINRLNEQNERKYRLPTEAEWEYAARSGGMREKFSGTSQTEELDQYAWYAKTRDGKTHPVGQKNPNGLGLYDMSGNVYEYCADWYGDKYISASLKNNPKGSNGESTRVLRGGSWFSGQWTMRASYRGKSNQEKRTGDVGFRLALSPR